MSMKADWYVLPGEFVAASGTVIFSDSSYEIRVLQNRIILANDESSDVRVYNMKNIAGVNMYWSNVAWVITWRDSSDNYHTVNVGTNWDWAHQLFYHIQCRL